MAKPASEYVPAAFDGTKWDQIEPLARGLIDRPVTSTPEFERWLVDRSDLESACDEAETNLYITMTCRTDDAAAKKAFTTHIETITPRLKPLWFEMDRRLVKLAEQHGPPGRRYEVLTRDTRAAVELFRQENVEIETELEVLATEYQSVVGAMTVSYDGKEQTLPQMAKYQESPDRAVREATWRLVAERRLRDRDVIDGLFDRMVALRTRAARNAGHAGYIPYVFRQKRRFDYTPADCERFHAACERVVAPFARRQDDRRRRQLGVPELRPWDKAVDPRGRPPLRPFEGGRDLMRKSVTVFRKLDPRLADMLASLGDGSEARGAERGACLDLDSRKGKAPGGYQSMRDRTQKPFIFMNAAGLQRDAETMLHEAGHAFHSLLCLGEPLRHYRHAPLEFCEVASMSMELITMPHWGGPDGYYPAPEDLARARRQMIEKSVTLLPWIATIDAFQHWIYSNPDHTRDERTACWLALDERFGPRVSWAGLDDHRAAAWHRQMHPFCVPMYYIEYGIAQLGALQLWLRSLEQGERAAIDSYVRGLSLGGSRPLPELFEAAGLKFDFGPETVARIVERVEKELDKLPE